MASNPITELSNEALLDAAKKQRSYKTYDAVILGFLFGISVYSSVRNGLGLLTFLPAFYLPAAGRNRKRLSEINTELERRGLS